MTNLELGDYPLRSTSHPGHAVRVPDVLMSTTSFRFAFLLYLHLVAFTQLLLLAEKINRNNSLQNLQTLQDSRLKIHDS